MVFKRNSHTVVKGYIFILLTVCALTLLSNNRSIIAYITLAAISLVIIGYSFSTRKLISINIDPNSKIIEFQFQVFSKKVFISEAFDNIYFTYGDQRNGRIVLAEVIKFYKADKEVIAELSSALSGYDANTISKIALQCTLSGIKQLS